MSHICDGRDLSCASCLSLARRLDTVRAAMTVDDELDDVKRARIWTRLEERLTEVGPARGSRARIVIGVAAAAAVAAAGLFAALARNGEPHTLAVPVDTIVTSQLGPHTFASVVGPAQLDIVGVPGDTTTVHLRSGKLLVDFTGGTGRSLRVEAPRMTIDVVGTLFAVTARDGMACTSVAHGRVRITMPSGVLYVGGGQHYCSGEAIDSIGDDMREALTRHHARREPPAPATATATEPRRAERMPSTDSPTSESSPSDRLSTAMTTSSQAATLVAPAPSSPAPTTQAPSPTLPSRTTAAPPPSSPARTPAAPSPGSRAERIELARPSEAVQAIQPAKPQVAPVSPEELYRAAEAALAARDPATADLRLAEIVNEHPTSPLVDQALYERARIAYQQRAWQAARNHLARLATIPGARFAEQGAYLRCRVAVETKESSAMNCLAGFRTSFRNSPHDLDALALLVQLAHARAGCAGAAPLVEELAETYARTTLAAAWRARCPEAR